MAGLLSDHDEAVIAEAKRHWDEREAGFPAFTRQPWEQGTFLARYQALIDAAERMKRQSSLDGLAG